MIPERGTKQSSSVGISLLECMKSDFRRKTKEKVFFSRASDTYIIDQGIVSFTKMYDFYSRKA